MDIDFSIFGYEATMNLWWSSFEMACDSNLTYDNRLLAKLY